MSNPSLPSPNLADTDEHLVAVPKTSAATQPSNTNGVNHIGLYAVNQMATLESAPFVKLEQSGFDARTRISDLLKDKEQEWTAVAEKKGPLRLLDLPVDVLKEIVKEVRFLPWLFILSLPNKHR